ncbi:hypothetical protein [Peribacillus frigoritolerans]|uniref:hypothetical protein n=1 Tax=Peribacillus frigoritolerans TaxID=450367 RepID=UPI00203B38FB|nr:hypothetical protein [Peribacillus frigoritolerans]MCM3169717.1 hypothetical protein [Peribacillus frigoritolerans]
MIEWLAFFGATESNGVTRILYSKERMSAQQAKKAEDGKKLITYFDSVCFRASLRWNHSDQFPYGNGQGWGEYGGAYGVVSHIVGLRRYTVEIICKSDHAGTTPIPTGRMLSSGFGIQCSEWHR